LTATVAFSLPLHAQAGQSGSSYLLTILAAIVAFLILGAILLVGNNVISLEAQKAGVSEDLDAEGFSLSSIFAPKVPDFAMGKGAKVLRQGFDLDLEGDPDNHVHDADVKTFALQPTDYRGNAPIPKVVIEVGDSVKAGDVVFYDKQNPDIKYVAPVSGEYISLNRGAKRAITELVFLADKEQQYKAFKAPDLDKTNRDEVKNFLLESGAWSLLRQRPFNIVADPKATPSNIFVSTFDTAPLAPNLNLAVAGRGDDLNAGIEALNHLTDGKVYLGLNAGDEHIASEFVNAEGCEQKYFMGKHPAGNVGIQIHHTAPIAGGDTVFTVNLQDLLTIGNLFLEGKWDTTKIVALSGSEFENQTHVRTKAGANIGELIKGNITNEKARVLSGDVLTGKKKTAEQFLNIWDDQITTVEEGDYYEMFGWILPQSGRPSLSPTFFKFGDTKFKANTNMRGEKRAFVMSGQYEDVLPMDVYPQHLMKAILANDFERMEGLGIYELVEEDIAICEFVCTSKQPLQKILRDGLDYVKEQG